MDTNPVKLNSRLFVCISDRKVRIWDCG